MRAILDGDARLFSATPAVPALTNIRSDKTGREDVAAGYIMGGTTIRRWEVLAGARIETTKISNTIWRNGRVNPAAPTAGTRYDEATGSSGFSETRATYRNVTPSVHLNYRMSDRAIFRAAAWSSIARPEYRYIEAGETYNFNANGEITSITRGNPDLKPAEARNFDVGFEYYTRDGGLVSMGLYHKRIRNFILGDNGASETVVGAVNNLPVPVSQPKNGSAAEITGVELTFQQQLRSLPAPFDGLGVAMNLTLQSSEAETGIPFRQGRKVEFMNSPETLWNAALVYEKDGWEARFAASFNGSYIEDLRAHAVDKWIQSRTQYDFKISRRAVAGWRVFFEAQNLTNEPVYWATHGRKITNVKDYTEVGTTYLFGVNWSR
jgi:TonB-dependent receptor